MNESDLIKHYRNTELYFQLIGQIEKSIRDRNYSQVIIKSKICLDLIPSLIITTKLDFGQFIVQEIPPIIYLSEWLPIYFDSVTFQKMKKIINQFDELVHQRALVNNCEHDLCTMNELKVLFNENQEYEVRLLGKKVSAKGSSVRTVLNRCEKVNKVVFRKEKYLIASKTDQFYNLF